MDGVDLDVFSASGHKWRSSSMHVATNVPSELLLDSSLQSPSPSLGRRVHGVHIPPLNLRGSSRPTDPWDIGSHRSQPPASSGPRLSTTNGMGSQPVTPERRAGGGTNSSGGGGGDGRHRQSNGAWHMPAKDWRTMHGGGGGGDRRSSSTVATDGAGGGAAAAAALPPAALPPAAPAAAAAPAVYAPDGVEGDLTEEERVSRGAVAQKLGMSYTTRAYTEHLEAQGMRPPGVPSLERIPTPTEGVEAGAGGRGG
ncbi:hypothetical protein PLESTB_001116300 [Pleodorina starrii]|uniref:Uncharacterized protein n=1 Tax=Pleodorina starrii TaxID=330485 RepID=A0A9W6F5L2_9CHLO|nr:hypothetical protein PLESTB_001116300 [Pleodorina starrii]